MVVEPGRPVVRDHVAPVVVAAVSPPAPELASDPPSDPPPTWEWAVSVLPALAEHHEVDPGPAALARFLGWFDGGKVARVHAYLEDACHVIAGSPDHQVTFAGHAYTLEPRCQGTETITQTCLAGGQRRCERCTRISLHPHSDRMGWGTGKIGVAWAETAPVDCTQACPADEWTPLVPRLATVLAGRRFSGVLAGEGPVVFRSASGCAREQRRRKAAAAAARKAERAAAAE